MSAFEIHLIKPTRYDEEGYPVQWLRSIIPSNSLACMAALVEDAKARNALGPDVDVRSTVVDETNAPVFPKAIIARHKTPDVRVLVMLVGVQTNQFPRAIDIARPLRAAGVPVCIGGFHVSGCVAMLGPEAPELAPARELGISMFAGEAEEGRLDEVLRDGFHDRLKPLYNYMDALPPLSGAPTPMLSREVVERTYQCWSSFDLGRGCPFECSFCTIINVQGRKSRFRDVDDLERLVRDSREKGVWRFFVTDDNLARNRNWEAYADRLIELREKEGVKVKLIVQVDTLAHRIPNFIDKMYRAGAHIIFIGLESVNPDNLESVKKRQNRIEEYREMLLAWKRLGVVVVCGYIIGFPNDTKASILRDIETIKRELPIDLINVNCLTPLPGSEDHKKLRAAGTWMDPDFNKYDLNHRVTHHPTMSDREWDEVFKEATGRFFTHEHMARVLNRMMQMKTNQPFTTLQMMMTYRQGPLVDGVGPSEFGIWRVVRRRERRHGMPLENPLVFYPRIAARALYKLAYHGWTYGRLRISLAQARARHRKGTPYADAALAAPSTGVDNLVLATEARSTPSSRRRQQARTA
jgi:uncharacterized radical SAM superfamily protein